MKKILALILALCCIVSLAACSKNTDNLPALSSISETLPYQKRRKLR